MSLLFQTDAGSLALHEDTSVKAQQRLSQFWWPSELRLLGELFIFLQTLLWVIIMWAFPVDAIFVMLALCFYKDNWMLGLGIWPLWGGSFVEFPCSKFLWLFFFSPTLSPSWFWYSIIFSYIPDQEMLLFLILWNFCIFQNRMGEKGDKLLITVVV